MYQSFKKIVGTFNTLVTCKDYENVIYNLKDDFDNNYVSNVVVSDITNDYNKSIKIPTYNHSNHTGTLPMSYFLQIRYEQYPSINS